MKRVGFKVFIILGLLLILTSESVAERYDVVRIVDWEVTKEDIIKVNGEPDLEKGNFIRYDTILKGYSFYSDPVSMYYYFKEEGNLYAVSEIVLCDYWDQYYYYLSLRKELRDIYGLPRYSTEIWYDDTMKLYMDLYVTAVEQGDALFTTAWFHQDTAIFLQLYGYDGLAFLEIVYQDRETINEKALLEKYTYWGM